MKKKHLLMIYLLLTAINNEAFSKEKLFYDNSGSAYLRRFTTYLQWKEHLPQTPTNAFLLFITANKPLANKLRALFLYQLALKHDFPNYLHYYKPSQDKSLQCYEIIAQYYTGNILQAEKTATNLWLTGISQPPACNQLFNLLINSASFNQQLITKRIIKALDIRNIELASYLLKLYKPPKLYDEKMLIQLHKNPSYIKTVHLNKTSSTLEKHIYLYGLKRLISINSRKAIHYEQQVASRGYFQQSLQQDFFAELALYKAMHNEKDTRFWFTKVNPSHYNDNLLEWQIRFALKELRFLEVQRLISHLNNKHEPCWQYWLARSLSIENKAKAREIYKSIAKTRSYYGFLASLQLDQKLQFIDEPVHANLTKLQHYQPFLDKISNLYIFNKTQASKLLNDFISELPANEKTALVYWLANHLHWYGKSVYLSDIKELNNQLSLRFPLPYQNLIADFSKKYQIPKALIYAMIRQESGFRTDVVSVAGARGLMQIMPSTALTVAKKNKIIYSNKNQLFLSPKNIILGIAYLNELAKRFHNEPLLMIAAYNAGPSQAKRWLKDSCSLPMDIWIETIPWSETRNYLKNVIAFYAVYQYRMHQYVNTTKILNFMLTPFCKI